MARIRPSMVAFPRLIRRAREDWTTEVAGPRRLRRTTGQLWVLVAAAFLLGAVLASAAFVAVWRHEASRGDSTERALSLVTAERNGAQASVAKLDRALARSRKALRDARITARRQSARLSRVLEASGPIVADAARIERRAEAVESRGTALATTSARLGNAVAALSTYLGQKSPAQIDPAYIDAQLSYLRQTAARIEFESGSLGAATAALASERAALARRAAALGSLTER